jgi:hypothetical protein
MENVMNTFKRGSPVLHGETLVAYLGQDISFTGQYHRWPILTDSRTIFKAHKTEPISEIIQEGLLGLAFERGPVQVLDCQIPDVPHHRVFYKPLFLPPEVPPSETPEGIVSALAIVRKLPEIKDNYAPIGESRFWDYMLEKYEHFARRT